MTREIAKGSMPNNSIREEESEFCLFAPIATMMESGIERTATINAMMSEFRMDGKAPTMSPVADLNPKSSLYQRRVNCIPLLCDDFARNDFAMIEIIGARMKMAAVPFRISKIFLKK